MTSTRITGGILVLLLISILSFEAAGMGISSYLSVGTTNTGTVNYLSMILEAVAIGVIAIVLMVTLFSLFSNASSSTKAKRIAEDVTNDLQEKHNVANQSVMKIHEHEKSVYSLVGKLHQRFEVLDKLQASAEEREASLEHTTEKLQSHERDLQRATESIGNRLTQVQSYWDDQLEETVDTVQRIRSSLGASLNRVDNSMERLKEQEIMSQQFTKKLLKNYEEQSAAQKENNLISTHVRESLEATLGESNQLLEHLQKYHRDAEDTFKNFSTTMQDYETQTYEQFEDIFSSTDSARKELQAGLEDSKQAIENIKSRDKDAQALTDRVSAQLDSLETDRVEIMTKTLKDTNEMCNELKQGMNDTQDVLYGLKALNTVDDDSHQFAEEISTTDDEADTSNNVEELDITPKHKQYDDIEEENKLISFFSRR